MSGCLGSISLAPFEVLTMVSYDCLSAPVPGHLTQYWQSPEEIWLLVEKLFFVRNGYLNIIKNKISCIIDLTQKKEVIDRLPDVPYN
jgi:hypothetical protein